MFTWELLFPNQPRPIQAELGARIRKDHPLYEWLMQDNEYNYFRAVDVGYVVRIRKTTNVPEKQVYKV